MAATLALIVAVAQNRVIGRDGKLPWRIPDDLRRFRTLTTGHTVVMGRRTWESLPRALPDRQNIVVTRDPAYRAPGAIVARTLDDALARAERPPPVFCIGGGELYRSALPFSQLAYVTEIAHPFEGDATFPALDPREWREAAREPRVQDDGEPLAYAFVTYERRHGA